MMFPMILIIVSVMLVALVGIMYVWTSNTMSRLEHMIDQAIDNTFSESSFNEKKLSKLEAKMYRYLSAGSTSLRQVNQEKDRIKTFIADISHQTKTPIANILLYAQLLKEAPELDQGTRQIVGQSETQTEKLNFLIASLVKTSRLENGIIAVAPKQNRVGELLRQLDQEYESCAEKKGVGIGLYLAREIVSKEGGYIKVSSELSKGSVFSVFLPKSRNK